MSSDSAILLSIPDNTTPSLSIYSPPAFSLINPDYHHYLYKRGYLYNCMPIWKLRYIIIKGGYLFKYSKPTSSKPKGTPINIKECSIELAESNDANYPYVVRLNTLVKEYVFAVSESKYENEELVRILIDLKQHAIKKSMGHESITKEEKFAVLCGDSMVNKKLERENSNVSHSIYNNNTMAPFN